MNSLQNYIKYCLAYIKFTHQRNLITQQKFSVELPQEYFELSGFLNGDMDGSLGEEIRLETFYSLDPKQLTIEIKEKYKKEKTIADKIEDIYNKYRNDQFTKQINLSFGFFEIELPIELKNQDVLSGVESEDLVEAGHPEDEQLALFPPPTKVEKYPLFSLPIRIEKQQLHAKREQLRYVVYPVDNEIQVNLTVLEQILGEDLYYQLVEEVGRFELDGKLSIPFENLELFKDIWYKIKERLKHTNANFGEDSFNLFELKVTITAKVNYFLAEDLQKLSKLAEEELRGSSLTGWIQDDELSIKDELPLEKDLYFPFVYDKYQVGVLSILKNKAAIVQGPPGTGKSQTIANILCHLAAKGHKILFVSQKAQALKVVKDKLRTLNVRYLFGYIPNPRSAQLGETDELDGIAPQLASIDAHIMRNAELFSRKSPIKSTSLPAVIELKDKKKETFQKNLELQRKLWEVKQSLSSYKKFDIPVNNIINFERNFSLPKYEDVKGMQKKINELSEIVNSYSTSNSKSEFDNLFQKVEMKGKKYCEFIGKIKEDVEKTGYDRHSSLMRGFNNFCRNFRLSKIRSYLPREIIDYIDKILCEDVSKTQMLCKLDSIFTHCAHYENIERLEDIKETRVGLLKECGLLDSEFKTIDELIQDASTDQREKIKENILFVYKNREEFKKGKKETQDLNKIADDLKQIEKERSGRIAGYLQNILDNNISKKWELTPIRRIIKSLSKIFEKSRRAFKTFDNLRRDPENFKTCLDLIPIWIMELDDASRIIPLQKSLFDYVLFDEASQCNIAYTLPAMFRAERALFVGDSEQMRDNTILFKSNQFFDELAKRYQIPENLQIKASGSTVQSVLDISNYRGFLSRPLRFHYRSPSELIGFSNKYFYAPKGKELIVLNNTCLTYKDTNKVMLTHIVISDWKEEFSDKVNVAEANKILKLFKELRTDSIYKNKSIGILTFFNAQAAYIRELFELEGYKEEEDNYKISIIEGIQGDEKDIIIYSFVIRDGDQKNKYIPLTGEGGDIRGDINKGRVNVAFSRARLQVHCFVSISPSDYPEGIWVKKYLKYIEENGEVKIDDSKLQPFDSHFEEEFYKLISSNLRDHYQIRNQVRSCGFKIDFVLTNIRTGRRIAIECDGPSHFENELDQELDFYIENDLEREGLLRAAGWEFYRIKYSDWIEENLNRNLLLKDIKRLIG